MNTAEAKKMPIPDLEPFVEFHRACLKAAITCGTTMFEVQYRAVRDFHENLARLSPSLSR